MTTTYSGIEIYRMSQTPTWKNSITNADSLAYSKDLYKLYSTTSYSRMGGRIYVAIKANVEITRAVVNKYNLDIKFAEDYDF